MAKVYLKKQKTINNIVSKVPGVRLAVRNTAANIARKADGRLAANRETGNSRISVTHGKTDSFVNLDDPIGTRSDGSKNGGAADAIEATNYIIRGAAGLAG